MAELAFFDGGGTGAHGFVADSLVTEHPVPTGADGSKTPRRWGALLAGSVVVLLLIGVTVTSLGWNEAKGRGDRLAAKLTVTRAELTEKTSEASNLQKQVSNLQADKNVLNIYVQELESEKVDLQIDNEDLTSTNEAISSVVQQLDQCLTEMRELGGQLLRNPETVAEERIRRASAQCAAARAAAAVLKATTTPAGGNAV